MSIKYQMEQIISLAEEYEAMQLIRKTRNRLLQIKPKNSAELILLKYIKLHKISAVAKELEEEKFYLESKTKRKVSLKLISVLIQNSEECSRKHISTWASFVRESNGSRKTLTRILEVAEEVELYMLSDNTLELEQNLL